MAFVPDRARKLSPLDTPSNPVSDRRLYVTILEFQTVILLQCVEQIAKKLGNSQAESNARLKMFVLFPVLQFRNETPINPDLLSHLDLSPTTRFLRNLRKRFPNLFRTGKDMMLNE